MAKAKAKAKEWQGDERRGNPRVRLQKGVNGAIQGALQASVVDLSMSGALLEVPTAPPTSSRFVLKLPLETAGDTLDIAGEVVRSYVHGFDKEGTGPPSVKYRAAMHFLELGPAERDGLAKFLEERGGETFRAELSS